MKTFQKYDYSDKDVFPIRGCRMNSIKANNNPKYVLSTDVVGTSQENFYLGGFIKTRDWAWTLLVAIFCLYTGGASTYASLSQDDIIEEINGGNNGGEIIKGNKEDMAEDNDDDIVELTPEFQRAIKKYNQLGMFSEGLATVSKEEHKWGYINTKGEEVIPANIDAYYVGRFSEGLAFVWCGGFKVIDTSGKTKFRGRCYFDSMHYECEEMPYFINGKLYVVIEEDNDYKYAVYDRKGNIIKTVSAEEGEAYYKNHETSNYTIVSKTREGIDDHDKDSRDKVYGLKDVSGKQILEAEYDIINGQKKGKTNFNNGVVLVVISEFYEFDEDDKDEEYKDNISEDGVVYEDYIYHYGYADMKGNDTFSPELKRRCEQSKIKAMQKYENQEDIASNEEVVDSIATDSEMLIDFPVDFLMAIDSAIDSLMAIDSLDVGIMYADTLSSPPSKVELNPMRQQLPDIENQLSDTRLKELHKRAAKVYAYGYNSWEGEYTSKWKKHGGQLMLLNYIFAADEARFEEKDNYKCLYGQKEWEQVCTAMLGYYFKSRQRSLPTTQPARFNAVEKEMTNLAEFVGSVYEYKAACEFVESSEVDRKLNRYVTLWLTREIYAKAPQSALAALEDERQTWEDLRDCVLTTCAEDLVCAQLGGDTPVGSFIHNMISQNQKEVDDFRKASIKRFSAIIGAGNFNESAADQPTINNPEELLTTFRGYFADSEFKGDENEVTKNTKATIAAYKKFEACRKRVEETLPENMRAAYAKETRAYLNLIDFE